MLEGPIAETAETVPLTSDEVASVIARFEASEWARLKVAARRLGHRSGMDPEDLLQEACLRALRGTRKIDRGPNAVWTMIGSMKSIASNEMERREGVLRPLVVPPEFLALFASEDLGPESFTISSVDNGRLLADVRNALAGDQTLLRLVDALCDGLFGQRLEKHLDLDQRGLAALRTRLKRTLRQLQLDFKRRQTG
ncbi:sigma factor [Sphingomonas koreensis]|nr:sigma factor [Sphingomonas koreensis]PJI88489.1 sigma-70-like protein [Sphingomonas koreensis]